MTEDSCDWDLHELLVHRNPMLLLDRVLSATESSLIAEVTPHEEDLFYRDGCVGSWVGIEYMAQAIGAWVGCQKKAIGASPKIGFLLGCRRYSCDVVRFELGKKLRIEVYRQFQADNGLAQFECLIYEGKKRIAQAELKVFEPEDASPFLTGSLT